MLNAPRARKAGGHPTSPAVRIWTLPSITRSHLKTGPTPPASRAFRRSVSALNSASSNAAAVRGCRLSRSRPVARGVLGRLDLREMPLTTGVHMVTTSLPVVCRRTKSTHAWAPWPSV